MIQSINYTGTNHCFKDRTEDLSLNFAYGMFLKGKTSDLQLLATCICLANTPSDCKITHVPSNIGNLYCSLTNMNGSISTRTGYIANGYLIMRKSRPRMKEHVQSVCGTESSTPNHSWSDQVGLALPSENSSALSCPGNATDVTDSSPIDPSSMPSEADTGVSTADNSPVTTEDTQHQSFFTSQRLAAIYCSVGGLGLTGNIFVLVVIFNYTAMRKSITNMFIINQSFIDATASLILILGVIFQDEGQTLKGTFGLFLCKVWYSKTLLWGALNVSTFNLLALSLERYLAVVFPLKYKVWITAKRMVVACAAIWVVAVGVQMIVNVFPAGLWEGKCNLFMFWPNKSFQQGVGVFIIMLKFVLPMTIMCFCYIRIAVVLKVRVRPGENASTVGLDDTTTDGQPRGLGNDEPRQTTHNAKKPKDNNQRVRRNVVKTLVAVTICFALCWVFNQTLFLYFNLGNPIDFNGWIYHSTVILVYCNCCCNPFIYIVQYRQFQTGVKRLKSRFLPSKFGGEASLNSHSGQTVTLH